MAEDWDVPLPGLEPRAPQKPPRTKRQEEQERRVHWRKVHKTVTVWCYQGTYMREQGGENGILDSSWVRSEGGRDEFLCRRHATERRHRDQLDGKA